MQLDGRYQMRPVKDLPLRLQKHPGLLLHFGARLLLNSLLGELSPLVIAAVSRLVTQKFLSRLAFMAVVSLHSLEPSLDFSPSAHA